MQVTISRLARPTTLRTSHACGFVAVTRTGDARAPSRASSSTPADQARIEREECLLNAEAPDD